MLLHKLRIGPDGQPVKQRRLNTPPVDLCLADALVSSRHPSASIQTPSIALLHKVIHHPDSAFQALFAGYTGWLAEPVIPE